MVQTSWFYSLLQIDRIWCKSALVCMETFAHILHWLVLLNYSAICYYRLVNGSIFFFIFINSLHTCESFSDLWYAIYQSEDGFKGRPVNRVPTQVYSTVDLTSNLWKCAVLAEWNRKKTETNRIKQNNRKARNKIRKTQNSVKPA